MSETAFERTIRQATGRTVEYAQVTPLDQLRLEGEAKHGRSFTFVSFFPWVGRGNIMRDRLVNHEEAEAACDDAIRRLR
jgi:hypothetical protein